MAAVGEYIKTETSEVHPDAGASIMQKQNFKKQILNQDTINYYLYYKPDIKNLVEEKVVVEPELADPQSYS